MEAETSLGGIPWVMFNTQAETARKAQALENALWCELGQGFRQIDSQHGLKNSWGLGTSRVGVGSRERGSVECLHVCRPTLNPLVGQAWWYVLGVSVLGDGDKQISGVHWPASLC